MPTPLDAIEALRTTLTRVDKLAVGFSTGSINPPYALIGVPAIPSYRDAFAGSRMTLEPTVTLLTSAAIDEIGTLRLIEFSAPSGERSIKSVIERDRKLGGVVEDCQVVDFRPLDFEEIGAIQWYGGVFTLRMMLRGDA